LTWIISPSSLPHCCKVTGQADPTIRWTSSENAIHCHGRSSVCRSILQSGQTSGCTLSYSQRRRKSVGFSIIFPPYQGPRVSASASTGAESNTNSENTDLVACSLAAVSVILLVRISYPYRPCGQHANVATTSLFSVAHCPQVSCCPKHTVVSQQLIKLPVPDSRFKSTSTITSQRGKGSTLLRVQRAQAYLRIYCTRHEYSVAS
jgi:hypothetical protein